MNSHLECFWAKVRKTDTCWLWIGAGKTDRYGKFWDARAKRVECAHRVSWEIHFGPIPRGLVVCHKCDNPKCVNPDHLFVGTQADNLHDMWSKNRQQDYSIPRPRQIRKLTPEQVVEIKSTYVFRKNGITVLGKKYGVHPTTIHAVISGKNWS